VTLLKVSVPRQEWRVLRWLCILLTCATAAHAQAPPGVFSPIPGIQQPQLPKVAPGTAIPTVPVQPAPTENVTHAISDVSVGGATAYPPDRLAAITAGLVGPAVPQSAIEAARVALVNLYRNDGYVYTAVSAVISGPHLRFVVSEGHITGVKLDGDIGPAGVQVLRFLDHLTDVQPLDVASLERWLLLASDVPGITIRSVLNPSAAEPGALTLVAQVSRQAVSGLLTADNRAYQNTGPQEGLVTLDFNSFSEFGERSEAQIYTTFNNEQIFGQASTEVFIGASGLKLKIYGGAGNALPGGPLQSIDYSGQTNVFGAQLSYPVIRARQQTLNALLSFDALDSTITSTVGGITTRGQDSLRVFSIGPDYVLLDVLLGPKMSATNGVTLRLWQGVPGLGASADSSADLPRLGERVDFTKVTGSLSRTQVLFEPWPTANVALQASMAGQGSSDILPPSEQFYLGGAHFNRGYYFGQVTGDSALTTSLELQLNTPLPAPAAVPFDVSAQFYTFYDWGETWQNSKLDADRVLNSVGGGVRLFLGPYAELDLEGVGRLSRYPNGTTGGEVRGAGVYWQVLGRF
jgi:hemolysin activation/secretion protein